MISVITGEKPSHEAFEPVFYLPLEQWQIKPAEEAGKRLT
jgi:hypothetical protein